GEIADHLPYRIVVQLDGDEALLHCQFLLGRCYFGVSFAYQVATPFQAGLAIALDCFLKLLTEFGAVELVKNCFNSRIHLCLRWFVLAFSFSIRFSFEKINCIGIAVSFSSLNYSRESDSVAV